MDIHTLLIIEGIIENIDDAKEIKMHIKHLRQEAEEEFEKYLKEEGKEHYL